MEPKDTITETYDMLMNGFDRTTITQEWPLQDGVYYQYSAYNNSCHCVTDSSYLYLLNPNKIGRAHV